MKSGLAGILEIVRILSRSGCDFAGEILVTAYGLHEAPLANGKGLLNLIEDGVQGSAALVFEGGKNNAQVIGKGQAVWDIKVARVGEVCHELGRDPAAEISTVSLPMRTLNTFGRPGRTLGLYVNNGRRSWQKKYRER